MLKILVLQTNFHAFIDCRETLEGLGLTEDKDFAMFDDSFGVERLVEENKKQLFITGSFRGSAEGVGEFVQTLRSKNIELVCASYSATALSGPFDPEIKKRPGEFEAAVKNFLEGKVKRSDDNFWEPPTPLRVKIRSRKLRRKVVVVGEDADTLRAIKESVANLNPWRAGEIFFTQNQKEAIAFLGKRKKAQNIIIIIGSHSPMFTYLRRDDYKFIDDIRWCSIVLGYARNPTPDRHLNAIIRRPKEEVNERHLLLARILCAFARRPLRGKKTLFREVDILAKKFPEIDIWSCTVLRPIAM